MTEPQHAPPALESKTTAIGRPMRILANLLVVVTTAVGLVLLLVLLIGQSQRANRLAENQRDIEIALAKTRKEAAMIATAQADRLKSLETRLSRLETSSAHTCGDSASLNTTGIPQSPRQMQKTTVMENGVDEGLKPETVSPALREAREALIRSMGAQVTKPKELESGNTKPPSATHGVDHPETTPDDHAAPFPRDH